jgi:glutamyl-tRNA synthetase
MSDVRVRIAPSPTGPPHVGTAYIALFNLAFARRHGGRFVLRVEDTDRSRSRVEYENRVMASLRWLGLDWDEGPDCGGPYGPYRQSERLELYSTHARQLVEQGHAYYCFCTAERLAVLRTEQMRAKGRLGYDGHCRALGPDDVQQRLNRGEPHVIRMRMPDSGTCQVDDLLRDPIPFDHANLDDQILLKSDGFPTYHLAVVVDDHLMGISHIIRGEEWISSTPKHLLLYAWFGWDVPQYAHLPLLLNPDGSKMSKRRNPTSIEYYRKAGYLAPALLNYLALMAYPPLIQDEEKFDFQALSSQFQLERINLGGSIFDLAKLDWLNGRYIREDLSATELLAQMKQWLVTDEYLAEMVPLLQPRMETLGDFIPRVAFFFARKVDVQVEDLVPKKRTAEEMAPMLQTAVWALETAPSWDRDSVEAALRGVASYWEWPVRDVTIPLIVAISGERVGPPLFESIALLGPDLTRMRLMEAMTALGGLSKKKAAKLEETWKSRATE